MSRRPLSKDQKTQIGIAAMNAFAHQSALGLVELPADMLGLSKTARADFWRHQQIAEVTQRVCSTREMIDDEYIKVKLHFEALAGPAFAAKALKTVGKAVGGSACDQAPGCHWLREMHDWLAKAGFKAGYAVAIAKAKFKTTDFHRLSERQLKQLHDTVLNRCRAKLGLGDPDNRNKKARGVGPGGVPLPKPEAPASTPRSRDYTLKRPASPENTDPDNIPF